jgi:NAD+ kinase
MKIALVSNPKKADAPLVAERLLGQHSNQHGVHFFLDEFLASSLHRKDLFRSDEQMNREAELLIVLGGDGTLLHAIKRLPRPGISVLGVNLGGMGFLTEFSADDFLKIFPEILKKNFKIEERLTLQVMHIQEKRKLSSTYEALNDAVITKGTLSRMLSLDVYVKDDYLTTYRADGLIVATPTGSTAHSLSSGGPIVTPNALVMILTPICPHTLSNRPLIVSHDQKIRIQLTSSSEMVGLTLDGQVGVELKTGDWIEVQKGTRNIPLVRFKYNYFEVLRQKLGWRGSAS